MANALIQSRVKPSIKEEAEIIFESIGLTTSDAIRIFLQQTINCGGLPFQLVAKKPNSKTQKAIKELEKGGGKKFKNTKELFEYLGI